MVVCWLGRIELLCAVTAGTGSRLCLRQGWRALDVENACVMGDAARKGTSNCHMRMAITEAVITTGGQLRDWDAISRKSLKA